MDRLRKQNTKAALVLLIVVSFNVLGAVILKEIATLEKTLSWLALAGFSVVISLNVLRLLVWRFAHKHYPLSSCYPVTAMFFPMMFLVSLAYDEPARMQQVAGVIMISAGVIFLMWKRNPAEVPVEGNDAA